MLDYISCVGCVGYVGLCWPGVVFRVRDSLHMKVQGYIEIIYMNVCEMPRNGSKLSLFFDLMGTVLERVNGVDESTRITGMLCQCQNKNESREKSKRCRFSTL